jgi:hypothetical protein
LTPFIEKRAVTQEVLDDYRDKPLVWGAKDCARMIAPVLQRAGYKPGLSRAGFYKTEAAALRGMRKAGYKDLAEWLDDIGLMRIPPAAAVAGDVIGFPAAPPWTWALSLALGNGRILGPHPEEGRFKVLQPVYRAFDDGRTPIAWRT